MSLKEALKDSRAAILSRESAASEAMLRQFVNSYLRVSVSLDDINRKIIAAQKAGKKVTKTWLYEQARFKELLKQVQIEIDDFSRFAETTVADQQLRAVFDAAERSQVLVKEALGAIPQGYSVPEEFARFNPANLQELAGRLSNGSPLRSLLRQLGPEAVQRTQDILGVGIVKGASPRETAGLLAKALEIPKNRALTISRTEVLGSYREASVEGFKQRQRAVRGWAWRCARNGRTCAMCIAMDGREFDLEVGLDSHPNCRCVPSPVVRSWKEMGFNIPDRRPRLGSGEEWFLAKEREFQLGILGREKLDLLLNGDLTMDQLVGYRVDKEWGPTRWERSLKDIREGRHAAPKHALGTRPS